MKEILLQIMSELQAKVPELAYIAEDWGQMDYYNGAPPVKFPCALISASSIDFETQTVDVRWGKTGGRCTDSEWNDGSPGELSQTGVCHHRFDGRDR